MSSSKDTQSATARKQWETENKVKDMGNDELYKYDQEAQQKLIEARPWSKDPHYFKKVKMSALALLKIVMHATVDTRYEIMGMMQGKVEGDTFIVLDSFALPADPNGVWSESRVGMGQNAIEFVAKHVDLGDRHGDKTGRKENVIGWYHSHPGFRCWLSGVDVGTQRQNQMFQDPFVAVVIDPLETQASGRVDLGSFRTYPEGYKAPSSGGAYQTVPSDKSMDMGAWIDHYYTLETEYFKSSTDYNFLNLLWNKYWRMILTSSPLISNRQYTNQQMTDLSVKLENAESEITRGRGMQQLNLMENSGKRGENKKDEPSQLALISTDSRKMGAEVLRGVISLITKDMLFNPEVRTEKK